MIRVLSPDYGSLDTYEKTSKRSGLTGTRGHAIRYGSHHINTPATASKAKDGDLSNEDSARRLKYPKTFPVWMATLRDTIPFRYGRGGPQRHPIAGQQRSPIPET